MVTPNGLSHDGGEDGVLTRRRALQLLGVGVALPGVTGTAAGQESFVDIIGTDPSSYPTIGLNVRVDSDAGRDGRLTEDDFTVTEGGEERELTGFEFSSTQLDLVFVFDDTGSMFNEIAGAKQQSKELTQQIADSGVDARYGLVSFKDDVEVDLSLTDDAAALQDALDDLFARGGGDGPEDNFDALERALEFDFRDGAQKVFIDITDNIAHYRGDGSGFSEYTLEEVKTDLMEQGVTYVAVSPGFDDEQASKQVLAEEVGGLYVDINGGDFDRILERITGILVESYIVRYETPLPPGTDVPIGVIVQDPERGEGSGSGRVTIPEDAGDGDGDGDASAFAEVREEKLALADQVDSLARDFDERPQVVSTLDALETSVDDGSLDEGTAVEAVERMKLGENVTEDLLADFGPETLGSEDPDTLVGNASDEPEYNTALKIVQSGINIIIEAVLSFFPFDKVLDYLPSGLVSKVDAAKSKLTKFIDFAVDTILGSFDDLARQLKSNAEDISDFIFDEISGEGVSKGANLAREQTNEVAGVQDTLADLLVGIYEDNVPGTPVKDQLTELNDAFAPTDGSLSLSGDLEGAETAARNGTDSVSETLGNAKETTETISDVIDIVGWLGLIAGALIASGFFSIAGATLNLVLFIFNVAANLLGIATGAVAMFEALDEHNSAIDGVINGGV